jgi:mRNA interferase MazF
MPKEESKEYDIWNELKKKIQFDSEIPTYFPQEGEIWMSSLGKNIGHEQNGSGDNFSRPVLVIKKFNNHMFWCIPLSTKQKPFDFYFNFTDPNNEKVSVILAQLKLISVKRLKRNLYKIDSSIFEKMREKLRDFIR